ncbi:hypothetical protein [Methylovulum miyakonense]|uniref:hypothetical protein n=1 Tax=Methylovulum miyakonense TaxID=645578 RepID=UPI000378E1CC|nr:hypothetical protein [Methylovulum miyakonense]
MQTMIDIEEHQLNKLLFYTHAKTSNEAILLIVNDYLSKKEHLNNLLEQNDPVLMQKKQLLRNIQDRFTEIPKEIKLADELIAERRIEASQE